MNTLIAQGNIFAARAGAPSQTARRYRDAVQSAVEGAHLHLVAERG